MTQRNNLILGGTLFFAFLLLTPLGIFNNWIPPDIHKGYYSVMTIDGNMANEGDFLLFKRRPNFIKIWMCKRLTFSIGFVGVNHKCVTSVLKAFLHKVNCDFWS